ncbi:ankyrin repeat domain-containing protein [Candidatus Falkowbacteria bacterium]|uniref:Uncharacterized protein n=1 Tax=Candidatus Buchananbacteria bacterium CG10_big_fil_rev_8_21_14_0_10_33_19 TaxID=1974525 RepID=A0A2H0W3F8_9BACT|nr:ankyrin repeat domain-containing protein [Candidatus Falkowbacteria bacterium]PIS05895.1 MAG: hypothetical protein COT80_03955 [Candidatus Buchananbacteria bacterium CG10_big_fil_rev_8_21_14_0_10_33_19]
MKIKMTDLEGYFKSLSEKELSEILIREISRLNPNLNFVEYLISLGANVDNSKNFYRPSISPLYQAASSGNLSVFKLLLDSGANVYEEIMFKGSPLHIAAACGHLEIIKYILSLGVGVDYTSSIAITPLHLAAKNGQLKVIEFLLDFGANIDSESTYRTPIHWAVIGNQLATVELLISRGANLDNIYYGNDGYGGKDLDLIGVALTESLDINMGHIVTAESRRIAQIIEKAKKARKTKS